MPQLKLFLPNVVGAQDNRPTLITLELFNIKEVWQ